MFFLTRAGRPQPPKWNSDWCFQLFLHTIHGYGKLKKLNHPNVSFQLVQTFSGWWFEPTPLKNDGVRQIGSSSQLGKKTSHVPNHQAVFYVGSSFRER